MRDLCHRCGNELPTGDGLSPFCPHCGATQLFLAESFLADQQPPVAAGATGALPPPLPRQVDWQAALRCSALVAAVAAVLSVVALRVPGISLINTVWTLTASMITLALYRRSRPLAWMDAGIGARIGLTTGLSLIVLIAAALAVAGLVGRFGLHAMAGFDTDFAQMIAQAKVAALASSAEAGPQIARFYDIPEFQAGIVLAAIAFSAVFLLLFSTMGGALGGLLRSRDRARL
jgi:hypothetical protein